MRLTSLFIYLNFQMALSRKNVLLDTLSLPPSPLSLSLCLSSLLPFHHPSHGALQFMDCVSGPERAA